MYIVIYTFSIDSVSLESLNYCYLSVIPNRTKNIIDFLAFICEFTFQVRYLQLLKLIELKN